MKDANKQCPQEHIAQKDKLEKTDKGQNVIEGSQVERKEHLISSILPGSIAEELELEPGDVLVAVNGAPVEDAFDYRYQVNEEFVTLLVRKPDGEECELEIDKEYEDDLGLVFETGLMDEYRSCTNRCIFCFIDQMPPGMRKTLYFKDDDARLSFLQGNYITLTNMKDRDIERIITYKLAPVNISVQTMNKKLRCRMLRNRFAGEALEKMRRLYEAGIAMNGQIVLCKGINDGEELEYSIRELTAYIPHMQSVSVVPVGLTKYREGLEPLEPFTKEDARDVLQAVHRWQQVCMRQWGIHFVHASDEWYLMAGAQLPPQEQYEGYVQLENGVGMLRLLLDEFRSAQYAKEKDHNARCVAGAEETSRTGEEARNACCVAGVEETSQTKEKDRNARYGAGAEKTSRTGEEARNAQRQKGKVRLSVATGVLAAPYIELLAQEFMRSHPEKEIVVYAVRNDFFGERITVSGLLTGRDLLAQLAGRDLGERLLLPCNLLRSGEEVFLDDMSVSDLKRALQVEIVIVNSNGQELYHAFSM